MAHDATVFLHGNLVRDPELKTVGQNKVAAMTVAVNTSIKKPDGTYECNFYDVSYWGVRGESFMERAQKGTAVNVIGTLAQVEYASKTDGKLHYRLRVEADRIKITARPKMTEARQQKPPTSEPMMEDELVF